MASVPFCLTFDDLCGTFENFVSKISRGGSDKKVITAEHCNIRKVSSVCSDISDGDNFANERVNVEEFCDTMISDVDKQNFEDTWNKRKFILEQAAEVRAMSAFAENLKQKKSLEEVIGTLLKDYLEIYERAHTVKLQFESEKTDWTRKIRQSMSEEMELAQHRKICRREGHGDDVSEYKQHTAKDDSFYQEFCYNSSQPNTQADGTFNADRCEEGEAGPNKASSNASRLNDSETGPSSIRLAKKFTVPAASKHRIPPVGSTAEAARPLDTQPCELLLVASASQPAVEVL